MKLEFSIIELVGRIITLGNSSSRWLVRSVNVASVASKVHRLEKLCIIVIAKPCFRNQTSIVERQIDFIGSKLVVKLLDKSGQARFY